MTIAERNEKLKALITCMKCEVSGKPCDDNCPTQYEAGHTGEIIENLEAISKLLEQEPETVTEFADRCRECGREKVLNKIRAEIDHVTEIHSDGEFYIKNIDVKRIIDKYKAESEDKENE